MTEIRADLVVDPVDEGTRLDRWLTDTLQELEYAVSRAQVQEFISNNFIVAARMKLRSSDVVKSGEYYHVRVPAPEPVHLQADAMKIDVVYEDEDVIVVNKPRGLVVHPAAGHAHGTLINGLVYRGVRLSHLGGEMRPGVVHRIDKDTSGLLMLAKTDRAFLDLAEQLKLHTVERRYQAIVHGRIMHEDGTIDAPIGRDPKNRQRMAVVENGKASVTHFHVLERFSHHTFVELKLETGRTHQIRVHMTYIGHPLVGDPLYGHRREEEGIAGQALHATTLGFRHPQTNQWLTFREDLPLDMLHYLSWLRERKT